MDNRPPKQQLADLLLDGGLDLFVSTRRENGVAWRVIARDLWQATDGKVDVAHQTLNNWYGDSPMAVAS